MKVASIPRASARLQFHAKFTFDDALALLPYFERLGISHLFASPVLTARPGSMHGYDVVDHTTVSAELGGEDGLRRLVAGLRSRGMGLIVDIVPNHMAVGPDNARWIDVLEWGRDSANAAFFDIDWDVPDPALNQRLLAPFLGKPYGEALADGDLSLVFEPASGRLLVDADGLRFALAAQSYAPLLRAAGGALAPLAGRFALRGSRELRRRALGQAQAELAQAAARSEIKEALDALCAAHSGRNGAAALHALLERQHYRLAWWRTAADEINWRRFFDITDLAALRIEEPAVFEAVHATIFRLYAEGTVDGLRIDHVDGLSDPRGYCRRLRRRLDQLAPQRPAEAPQGPAFIVVEKILAPGEPLPRDWLVDGTSGYSFMNDVGALMHDARGEQALTALWRGLGGDSFGAEERAARRRIPQELFAADFNACALALHRVARAQTQTRDWSLSAIRRVLAELLVEFPVYRTYADARGRSSEDDAVMQGVIDRARPRCRPGDRPLLELIDRWLGGEPPAAIRRLPERRARLRAIARFQQLTAPVAAKSVEDTAFYRHSRLLSRNEVGADPAQFSMSAEDFHAACRARVARYPHALLATATHDHKRGEDARMRLSMLSEDAGLWERRVRQWLEQQAPLRREVDGAAAPDDRDAYMIYQTLVGSWPSTLRADDPAGLAEYAERLHGWLTKALREAKRHSGWVEPHEAYEAACQDFLGALLDPARSAGFLAELQDCLDAIGAAGAVKGLAQALLRMTVPGVPDLYQGTEFWDHSLVDPDNRRPVDFVARTAALESSHADGWLLTAWRDGMVKQRLVARALAARAALPELFASGDYRPLTLQGARADAFVAFARCHQAQAALVVVPRRSLALLEHAERLCLASAALADTAVELAPELPRRWRCALGADQRVLEADNARLTLSALLDPWPVALLLSD